MTTTIEQAKAEALEYLEEGYLPVAWLHKEDFALALNAEEDTLQISDEDFLEMYADIADFVAGEGFLNNMCYIIDNYEYYKHLRGENNG